MPALQPPENGYGAHYAISYATFSRIFLPCEAAHSCFEGPLLYQNADSDTKHGIVDLIVVNQK